MDYFNDYSAYVDGTAIFVVLVSTIFAIYRGLVKEVLGFGTWMLAALAVIYAVPFSRPYTKDIFDSKVTADIVVGITVALIVLVICTLITYKSSKKIRTSALNGLDRTLGGLFGIVRGLFIVVILYFIAAMVFTKELEDDVDASFFNKHLQDSNDYIYDWIESYGKEENGLDELFQKLNEPEIIPEGKIKEGYKAVERQSLDQLILETSDTVDELKESITAE